MHGTGEAAAQNAHSGNKIIGASLLFTVQYLRDDGVFKVDEELAVSTKQGGFKHDLSCFDMLMMLRLVTSKLSRS